MSPAVAGRRRAVLIRRLVRYRGEELEAAGCAPRGGWVVAGGGALAGAAGTAGSSCFSTSVNTGFSQLPLT